MGRAQPLSARRAGAASLSIECQQSRIEKRIETRYLDVAVDTLDDAMLLIAEAVEQKRPLSVGLLGNAAEILPEMVSRNMRPDIVTDQTSAHDRSEEHTSELPSLMRISYAVFWLQKKKQHPIHITYV